MNHIMPWAISIGTIVIVYLLDKWDNKILRKVFNWIPAILLAYLIPAIVSVLLGKDFSASTVHDFSRHFVIPMAIVTVMSSLSIKQLKAVGWKPVIVFVAGSLWIALFPVLLMIFYTQGLDSKELFIDQGFWMGIPPIVGGWIGGSTSQLVLKELVSCPEAIFLTILVFDNLLVNIWTIIMFQTIKRSDLLNRIFKVKGKTPPKEMQKENKDSLSPWIVVPVLLIIVLVSNQVISDFAALVIALSLVGILLGNLIRTWNYGFVLKMGGILILAVMAILGLKLNFSLLDFNPVFFGFMVIWLVTHFFFMLLIAKLLQTNLAWVPIASMANVGGIATAPAVTAAYEKKWLPHAIVLAILSMATGTFWGMVTIYFLRILV